MHGFQPHLRDSAVRGRTSLGFLDGPQVVKLKRKRKRI